MYRIFMNEKYISVLPNRYVSEMHSHELLQMFMTCEEKLSLKINEETVEGNCIVIDGNTSHHVTKNDPVDFLMFIEPTCSAAIQFRRYFSGKHYIAYQKKQLQNQLECFQRDPTQETYQTFLQGLFFTLNIDFHRQVTCDSRIVQLTQMMESYRTFDYSVESISSRLVLSPSRLAHLFKEQTGMPLKSYLVMHRLIYAYSLLFQGKNITEAAIQSGFDSSSHFAMLNKKLTGVTASSILKNSEFLKASFFNL